MAKNTGTFTKFHEFSKIIQKDDGTHEVWGIATLEQPDSDNELCDYESAVPVYQAWSSKALKRTSGNGQEASLGNLRIQHGSAVGGKVTGLEFKDAEKEIWLRSEPIDNAMATALLKGFFTGYSQGGSYAWRACNVCGDPMPMQQGANFCQNCKKTVPVLYGLKRLAEVSYVDSPAIGIGFQSVKANGSSEIIKFQKHRPEDEVMKTKRVAGVDVPASGFAYVGDVEKTETWKLLLEVPGDANATKAHIRNSLARLDQTRGIPDEERSAVKARLEAAATAAGVDTVSVAAKSTKIRSQFQAQIDGGMEKAGFAKGLYAVGRMADMLETMSSLWEYAVYEREIEGDESDVPEEMRDILDSMIETFIAMATEEARELAAANKNDQPGDKTMTPEELQKQQDAEKAAKKSLASHFAKAASNHEKKAEYHEAMVAAHDKAGEAIAHKADTNEGEQAEHKPIQQLISQQAEFHKAAGKAHGRMAKAETSMAEHCDKMANACDEDEAKKVAKEITDADAAAIAKGDEEEPPVSKTTEDEFTRKAVANAQAELLKDPEFQKEVKARQREILLGKLAESGASALAAEAVVPTTLKGGAALVQRDSEGKEKFDFAKEAADTSPAPVGI